MSASSNSEAVANQGEFHSSVERSEPLTTHGHQPGKLVGNDAIPEFHAQTLPAGTAPADKTFKPNNISEVAPTQQNIFNPDSDALQTSASETIGGVTSGDVHSGLGKPMQGQTSNELRHDGEKHRKAGGAGGAEGVNTAEARGTVDAHDPQFAGQRALNRDDAEVGRGNVGGAPAEERLPETAESL